MKQKRCQISQKNVSQVIAQNQWAAYHKANRTENMIYKSGELLHLKFESKESRRQVILKCLFA